jgi:4-hydroxybenzoate polyprenyltransferase
MDGFTDIRAAGWVRHLPAQLIPYAILARFDRPIGAWLLFLPGLWSICLAAPTLKSGIWLTILFFIGAITMRGAGCVVNDFWDRKLDAKIARTAGRPLASGALKPINALVFLAILLTISLIILLQLNNAAKLLGVLSLIPVALYPLAKRVTWWPQIVLGLTFGWGAPEGFAAATGHLALPALTLYLAAIFWILGYDTIYAHQDREDDALIGVKSTARLFGENTRPLLTTCYTATIILVVVSMLLTHEHAASVALLLIPGLMLRQQITRLDIQNPALCLKLFKANRAAGLAIAAVIFAGRM